MRRISFILILMIIILPIQNTKAGILNAGASNSEGVNIVVSISAMATIISPILSPKDNLTILLPSNVEPHSFTLDPITLDKALKADIIVTSGHIGWEQQLKELAVESGKIVFDPLNLLGNRLVFLDVPGGGKNLHGYWLLPENVIVIAEEFTKLISEYRPSLAQIYNENLRKYVDDIVRLQDFALDNSKKMGLFGNNVLIGFYEEQYVAYSFGLNVVDVLAGSEEDLELSPQKLETVRGQLMEGHIKYIMVSEVARELPLYNYIEKLSSETGAKIILVRVLDLPEIYDFRNLLSYNIGKVGVFETSAEASSLFQSNIFLETTIISVIFNFILIILIFRRVGR
ncbi:MAG: zinc ABC transporter substrate-binding protein [Nitrososphaeria archaeon]|nr:zinc ABC transporter substrate-binding protein [Nitrososphaeria archaeon]